MLRKTLLTVVVIALTPAIAMAAPAAATKAPTAITNTVKAEKVAVVTHHKIENVKIRNVVAHKAKTTTIKS